MIPASWLSSQAEAINEEASSTDSSDLVNLAKQRLADMSFFGLFERLEDSMELLAHTMCWDFEGFEFQKQDRRHKRESPFLKASFQLRRFLLSSVGHVGLTSLPPFCVADQTKWGA